MTLIGQRLGAYEVVDKLGSGGMATVYRAYQRAMDRFVAVKVLPERVAEDPTFVERFKREALTIARLEHKNILPVYDFGEEGDILFLVMRYLDGGTIKDVMELGRPRLEDTIEVIVQIASALDYAHRQGVIHRDVKPANIMIDDEGDAYLTDFGIAKALEGATLTAEGMTVGTPAYMAPEQSLGKGVDARTDIYSLGVVLFEMVVGQAPYNADTPMGVALAHIHEPLPLPREIDPTIPPQVQAVLLRALAKEPADRYQSAADFGAALRGAITASEPDDLASFETAGTMRVLVAEAKTTRQPPVVPPETVGVTHHTAQADDAAPSRRGLPMGAIIGGVVALLVVGGLVLAALAGVFSGDDGEFVDEEPGTAAEVDEEPSTDAEVAPTEAPAAVDPLPEPDGPDPSLTIALFDDFDDDSFDESRWDMYSQPDESCVVSQADGQLVIDMASFSDEEEGGSFCALDARVPKPRGGELGGAQTIVSVASNYEPGGYLTGALWYVSQYPDGSNIEFYCGYSAGEGQAPVLGFEVSDYRTEESPPNFSGETSIPMRYDEAYLVRMEVDPDTMTFSCFADDTLLGSYTPENNLDLREVTFSRGFAISRGANVTGTLLLDDFAFIEAAQAAENEATSVYDDFGNETFSGRFDPLLWASTQEEGCGIIEVAQIDGVLGALSTEEAPSYSTCNLQAAQPDSVPVTDLNVWAADIKLEAGFIGDSGAAVELYNQITEDHNITIECGLSVNGAAGQPLAFFYVGDSRDNPDFPDNDRLYIEREVEAETWVYTEITWEPESQTVQCSIDDEPISSFTFGPEDSELSASSFSRFLTFWRSSGSWAIYFVDNVEAE